MKIAFYLATASLPFLAVIGEFVNEVAYVAQRIGCSPTENCHQRKVIDTSVIRRVPVVRDIQLR